MPVDLSTALELGVLRDQRELLNKLIAVLAKNGELTDTQKVRILRELVWG